MEHNPWVYVHTTGVLCAGLCEGAAARALRGHCIILRALQDFIQLEAALEGEHSSAAQPLQPCREGGEWNTFFFSPRRKIPDRPGTSTSQPRSSSNSSSRWTPYRSVAREVTYTLAGGLLPRFRASAAWARSVGLLRSLPLIAVVPLAPLVPMATAAMAREGPAADAAPPAKKPKLHGRAFYESIGSPKYIIAPMVDQSEFVSALTGSFRPAPRGSETG